ncbi:MAG: hypothetical protein R2875_16005 [Desulfobacterales bacterium]
MSAAPGFIGGQIFFQRLVFETADTAKKINLPGRNTQPRAVLFDDPWFAGADQIS